MQEDLYRHPLVEPLLHTGPVVPVEVIERLSLEIAQKKSFARQCTNLFRFEAAFQCTPKSYLTVWMAFALARAKNDKAITLFIDLFDLVDPVEHDMLWELAQFALWQYGDRAVRAVLDDFQRVVEIDHTGYYLGVLEVVGLSQDQLLRRRVADKVIDALNAPDTSPAALMGLVDLAMILEEPRLPAVLYHWKANVSPEERRVLTEVEHILLQTDADQRSDEYRLPWTDLAEFSAEHFSIHFQKTGVPFPSDSVPENIGEEFRALAQDFRKSSRFLELPEKFRKDPEQVVVLLTRIFGYLFSAFGTLPDEADAEEVSGLMREVLPKQMVGDPASFRPIPPVLIAFYRYMTDSYSKDEGDEFASLIRSSTDEMFQRAADPNFWDGHKMREMEKL
ncbi:MAG: hypothetical protein KJ645_05535 [Planctomycetes bacterium]|nr:hypothetical protein [Planctomycetota bacterium]